MTDWDKLSVADQAQLTLARKRSGHTSVAQHQRVLIAEAEHDGVLTGVCRALDELRLAAAEERAGGRLGGMFDAAADTLEARLFAPAGGRG